MRLLIIGLLCGLAAQRIAAADLDPRLLSLAERHGTLGVWVFLSDKPYAGDINDHDGAALTSRARARRAAHGQAAITARDLPVAPAYVDQIRATGARIRIRSRWLNAVSVDADGATLRGIAALPFVERLAPIGRTASRPPATTTPLQNTLRGTLDHGAATTQLEQIGVVALHRREHTGDGVVIGVLDSGFDFTHEAFNHPDHPLNVIAAYDFLNDDPNVEPEEGDHPEQHHHGTWILGTLAGYAPGNYVGAAPDAAYVLAKTEDVSDEYPAEEDYFVAGLEFCEQQGADIVTASLGYLAWYDQADLDGRSAVTTRAVNTAAELGVLCVNAAGNFGHDDDPATSHLLAPADAFAVLSVGAVRGDGQIVSFSSDGPTADGRVKPELLARGLATATVSVSEPTGYVYVSGTSLATPLVAGAAACLMEALPQATMPQIRERMIHTAADFSTSFTTDPLYVRGYGILDAAKALVYVDCDGDGIHDPDAIAAQLVADLDGDARPDNCIPCASSPCPGDLTRDCIVDNEDLGALLAAYLTGVGQPGYQVTLDLFPPHGPDGVIDNADLGVLLANYLRDCQ